MLTKEQQEVVDIAALRVMTLSAEHRVAMLQAILVAYVDCFLAAFPEFPEEAVRTNSVNYSYAIIRRIGDIEASGGTVGTA